MHLLRASIESLSILIYHLSLIILCIVVAVVSLFFLNMRFMYWLIAHIFPVLMNLLVMSETL